MTSRLALFLFRTVRIVGCVVVAATTTPLRGHADELSAPLAQTVERTEAGSQDPLTLDDVLASVDAGFPLIAAAEAEWVARSAEARAADGSFDTTFSAGADLRPVGFYQSYGGDAALIQPTRLWGTRFYGGYRIGSGDYPSYDGRLQTDGSGEIAGGLEVPLFRGGAIDLPRAEISRSRIDVELAGPEIELQRVAAIRDASNAFWIWVAAGRRFEVAQRLVDMAVARQSQIEGRVARGAQSRIDLVDNERLIVDRKLQLLAAERDLRQASIALSLYVRDDRNDSVVVDPDRLPRHFPIEHPPDRELFTNELTEAREKHPLIRILALEKTKLEVDAALARNDSLPGVNVRVEGSQDFGSSSPGIDVTGKLSPAPLSETQVKALVRLELPLQRREARGELAAARARITRLERREQYTRDLIMTDGLRAIESLVAAYEITVQARQNLLLAEKMRLAEERKLVLGSSNLIDVNIREVQEAMASQGLIDAQASYFRARADFEAVLARPTRSGTGPDERA